MVLDEVTHAGMFESALTIAARHTLFGRAELVGKPADDLHIHEYITQVFSLSKLQAGYVRHFASCRGLVPGIGATISASIVPALLTPHYEGRVAPGFALFVSFRPARHEM